VKDVFRVVKDVFRAVKDVSRAVKDVFRNACIMGFPYIAETGF
jgi:uncharacterized protein YoxC